MSEESSQMLRILTEMRDLLRLMAEPAIAERDKKLRIALRSLAGAPTSKSAQAILLMDGTRVQARIVDECGISKGNLSVLVTKLREAGLLTDDPKQPQLAITIPANFFE